MKCICARTLTPQLRQQAADGATLGVRVPGGCTHTLPPSSLCVPVSTWVGGWGDARLDIGWVGGWVVRVAAEFALMGLPRFMVQVVSVVAHVSCSMLHALHGHATTCHTCGILDVAGCIECRRRGAAHASHARRGTEGRCSIGVRSGGRAIARDGRTDGRTDARAIARAHTHAHGLGLEAGARQAMSTVQRAHDTLMREGTCLESLRSARRSLPVACRRSSVCCALSAAWYQLHAAYCAMLVAWYLLHVAW